MKKLLLSAIIIASTGFASAQVSCTPQYQDSTFGAWPDTTTNFAPAYVNIPYVQLLDFKAPSDAGDIEPTFSGFEIQSYTVTSVTGLPSGFTYNCSATNCQYIGGNAGCANLVGTASPGQEGTYNLSITITAVVLISPLLPTSDIPYTFNGYRLVILPQELSTTMVSPDQVYIYPNPATSTVNVVNSHLYESLEIYSVNGQLISNRTIVSSEEKVDISDLKEGVYFMHLIKDGTASIHKFVKK